MKRQNSTLSISMITPVILSNAERSRSLLWFPTWNLQEFCLYHSFLNSPLILILDLIYYAWRSVSSNTHDIFPPQRIVHDSESHLYYTLSSMCNRTHRFLICCESPGRILKSNCSPMPCMAASVCLWRLREEEHGRHGGELIRAPPAYYISYKVGFAESAWLRRWEISTTIKHLQQPSPKGSADNPLHCIFWQNMLLLSRWSILPWSWKCVREHWQSTRVKKNSPWAQSHLWELKFTKPIVVGD